MINAPGTGVVNQEGDRRGTGVESYSATGRLFTLRVYSYVCMYMCTWVDSLSCPPSLSLLFTVFG